MKNLLALDVATNTGWCNSESHGCWDFTVKKSKKNPQHPYSKLFNFKTTIEKYLDEHPEVNTIASERVSGLFKNAIISLSEQLGIIKLICFERNLEHIEYVSTELKKWATGSGAAKKPQMIRVAQEEYGMEGNNSDTADAIIIYHYHIYKTQNKGKLPIKEAIIKSKKQKSKKALTTLTIESFFQK
jgi:Holliday junction resolvasome RuvABC endonuclease subunit